MDLTYEEYVGYLNHLLLQEFTDFDFHDYRTGAHWGSCADALTIL